MNLLLPAAFFLQLNLSSAECGDSDDFKFTSAALSLDPKTKIEYRSTQTKQEIIMTTEASAFLGFGFASDGSQKMIGNNAVIGTLSLTFPPYGPALKYSLGFKSRMEFPCLELNHSL
jgi:hypothetical protein